MDTNLYVASKPTTASAAAAIGATSMTVAAVQDRLGNTLTMADFGTKGRGVISPGKDKEEQFTFTGISSTTISGISWVTMKAPYTETSGFAKAHAAGEKVILSTNGPEFYDTFLNKGNDETITGTYTFTSTAIPIYNSVPTVTDDKHLIHKKYADDLAIAGAPDGTESVKGIFEAATQTETDEGDDTGTTTAPTVVRPSKVANTVQRGAWLEFTETASGDDAYTATTTPTFTEEEGVIVNGTFATANTGACTFALNAGAAANMKKYVAGALADPETGDIVASQPVVLRKTGANWVLLNPSAAMPTTANLQLVTSGIATLTGGTSSNASALHKHSSSFKLLTYDMATASGTSAIAHGLGVTPRIVKITSYSAIGAAVKSWSIGSYDGTTTQSNTIDLAHTATETSNTYAVKVGRLDSSNYQTATVAYDGTNVTLTWTKTGTPTGNAQLFVESYA